MPSSSAAGVSKKTSKKRIESETDAPFLRRLNESFKENLKKEDWKYLYCRRKELSVYVFQRKPQKRGLKALPLSLQTTPQQNCFKENLKKEDWKSDSCRALSAPHRSVSKKTSKKRIESLYQDCQLWWYLLGFKENLKKEDWKYIRNILYAALSNEIVSKKTSKKRIERQ